MSRKNYVHPSDSDLKQFRSDIAKLKKAGLIPPNVRGKIVDARSARPTQSFGGSTLREYVAKYRDVIEGRAVSIPKSQVKETQGYQVATKGGIKPRVIVPLAPGEKVLTEKGTLKFEYVTEHGKITRVPVPRKNLFQYLTDAEKLPDLKRNEYYAFYIFGNKSRAVFRSAAHLREYLSKYDSVTESASRPTKRRELFHNLEIVKLTDRKEWEKETPKKASAHKPSKQYAREKKKYAAAPEWLKEKRRAKWREKQRKYRANKKK